MRDVTPRVEPARAVDPTDEATRSMGYALRTCPSASTRIINLLPMSSDESVTLVSNRPGFCLPTGYWLLTTSSSNSSSSNCFRWSAA
jgi:hypothetical protein